MIDVIIPAYNAHTYIKYSLESLEKQTIKDKLLITIVDDGSNLSYEDIFLPYSDILNINLIKLKRNYGQGYAKQKGIQKTNNPYIFFMDSDDKLTKDNALELLLTKIEKDKNISIVTGKEKVNGEIRLHEGHMYAKLFKREFIEKYKIKVPNYPLEEDIAFMLAVYTLATPQEILNIDDVIYEYCKINQDSVTNRLYKNYAYDYLFQAVDYAYKYAKKYNKYDYLKRRLLEIWEYMSYEYYTKFMKDNAEICERFLRNNYIFYKKYSVYIDRLLSTKYTINAYNFYVLIKGYDRF